MTIIRYTRSVCFQSCLFLSYLRKAVSGLPVFHTESFTWLGLCNINVTKYIQSSFVPSTHESDWLILHVLQFSGALQEFMIKKKGMFLNTDAAIQTGVFSRCTHKSSNIGILATSYASYCHNHLMLL